MEMYTTPIEAQCRVCLGLVIEGNAGRRQQLAHRVSVAKQAAIFGLKSTAEGTRFLAEAIPKRAKAANVSIVTTTSTATLLSPQLSQPSTKVQHQHHLKLMSASQSILFIRLRLLHIRRLMRLGPTSCLPRMEPEAAPVPLESHSATQE